MRSVSPGEALLTLYSADQVRARIVALVDEIARAYRGRLPLFVVIAEGARRFAAELSAGLERREAAPDTLVLRASRTRGTALGPVELEAPDAAAFAERDVLVIDDIADEGRTLERVIEHVESGAPRSLRVAVLVNKTARRAVRVPIDWSGFEVKDGWVVGFGMDLDGRYRDLDEISVIEERG
jgi:hypoxanthine phosphoribosyltransferase